MRMINFTDLSAQSLHRVLQTLSEENFVTAKLNHFERDAFMGAYSQIAEASTEATLEQATSGEFENVS